MKLLLLAVFVGALDQTVVAALLPAIVRDLSLPFDRLDQAAWAVTLYLAAYAAVVPFAGRLIDAGARNMLLVCGLVVFGIGSYICGRSETLEQLVASRVVQALGAGVLLPVALADASRGDARTRLLRVGIVAAVAEAGAVCGPIYGAAVLATLDWRWAFWINLPVVAAVVAISATTDRLRLAPLPWLALTPSLALGLALGVAVAGLSREIAKTAPWLPPACAVASAGLLLLVVRIESRRSSALASLGRLSGFWVILGIHLMLGAALVTPLVLIPVWANTLLGLDPPSAAGVLLWLTLAIPPTALLGAYAANRLGHRITAGLGFCLVAAALFLMGGWPATIEVRDMAPTLIAAGFGFGLVIAPLSDLVLRLADVGEVGSAVGLATAARVVGMAFGLAALTRWGIDALTSRLAEIPTPSFSGALAALGELADYQRAVVAIGADILGTLFRAGAICAAVAALGLLAVRAEERR